MVRKGLSLANVDVSTRARAYLALGDALMRRGEDPGAVKAYRQAMGLARDPSMPREDLVPRILVGMGEAQSESGDLKSADLNIRKGLQLDQATLGGDNPQIAHDLETLGPNLVAEGDLDAGRAMLERALAIRLKTQGPLHPRSAEDLSSLGAIAYLQHDKRAAESYFKRALASYRVVLGENHPEVANTTNNLARVELERRDYRDAEPMLAHVVDVETKQRGDTYAELAFEYENLGRAKQGLGDDAAAQGDYLKALAVARLHKHRNLAPILVDLADLACRRGDTAAGLARLREARPQMAKDYPAVAWRVAWVDVVEAGCQSRAGRKTVARAELKRSAPAVLQAWAPDTLYGARTTELLAHARAAG